MDDFVPAVEAFLSGNPEAVEQAHTFLIRVLNEAPAEFIEFAIDFMQDSLPQQMAPLFLFMMNSVFRSDSGNSLRSLIPSVLPLGISIAKEGPASAAPAAGALLATLARKFSLDVRLRVIHQILDSIRSDILPIVAFLCDPSVVSPSIAIEVFRAINPFLEASNETTSRQVLETYESISPGLLPALSEAELELFCSKIIALPGPTAAWYTFWSAMIEFIPIHLELFESIIGRSVSHPARQAVGHVARNPLDLRFLDLFGQIDARLGWSGSLSNP
jgi:hypothetical protein